MCDDCNSQYQILKASFIFSGTVVTKTPYTMLAWSDAGKNLLSSQYGVDIKGMVLS